MPERRSLIRLGLLGAALALLLGHALAFNFVNDDAFISFRYADNLVRHGELVYNVGERVEGFTNFLWTVLIAGVIRLGLDPVVWSKILGIACSVATLGVLARFSRKTEGEASGWDALAPAILAASPAFACWSTGGLETSLFTLLVTLGWTGYLREHSPEARGFPWSGAWFALAAMTRPEGMLFFGLTGLHRIGVLVFGEKRGPTARDWLWGAAFAGVFAPYYAWRWWYYGWPFPNTFYVKTGAAGFWRPGGNYVGNWVLSHHIWAVPVLAWFRRIPRVAWLALLYGGVLTVYVASVGGDFMALYRFMVPVMPLLAFVAAYGARGLWARLAPKARYALTVAVVAALGFTAVRADRKALAIGSEGGVDSIGWLAMFAGQCTAIGKWLAENAPADASIATTAAGTIPYYSRLYTLDVLGLNDEWIAHSVPAHGTRPGHTKVAPLDYVLHKQIDYLIYHPTIEARRPGQNPNEERAWAGRGYHWEAVQVPGLQPPWWGFWKRQR